MGGGRRGWEEGGGSQCLDLLMQLAVSKLSALVDAREVRTGADTLYASVPVLHRPSINAVGRMMASLLRFALSLLFTRLCASSTHAWLVRAYV